VPNPATAPIVQRIFHEAATGTTLRGIAARLSADGVVSPATYAGNKNGAKAWDPVVVRRMLVHPTYWGQPRAFVTQCVPLSPQERARGGYKHRTIRRTRPVEEQKALPARVAPALVSPELADQVQRHLSLNRQLASRNNRHADETLLHGGFARCAYCGGRLVVTGTSRRQEDGSPASTYQCKKPLRVKGGCQTFSIRTQLLDRAVWASVRMLLLDPRLNAYELERTREQKGADPAHAALAAIEAQVADLTWRIENKRKYAEVVDDDQERAEVAQEVSALRAQRRKLETERETAAVHADQATAQERAPGRIMDWAAVVGRNVEHLTMRQKREVLVALGARVHI
jgi:hypothetical protein